MDSRTWNELFFLDIKNQQRKEKIDCFNLPPPLQYQTRFSTSWFSFLLSLSSSSSLVCLPLCLPCILRLISSSPCRQPPNGRPCPSHGPASNLPLLTHTPTSMLKLRPVSQKDMNPIPPRDVHIMGLFVQGVKGKSGIEVSIHPSPDHTPTLTVLFFPHSSSSFRFASLCVSGSSSKWLIGFSVGSRFCLFRFYGLFALLQSLNQAAAPYWYQSGTGTALWDTYKTDVDWRIKKTIECCSLGAPKLAYCERVVRSMRAGSSRYYKNLYIVIECSTLISCIL